MLRDGDLRRHEPPSSGASSEFEQTREDTIADSGVGRRRHGRDEHPVGTPIGRYVVLNYLGQGGMGVVLAAYDPDLDRKVALKLLRGTKGGPNSSASQRLVHEAQALAKLSHPNVVAIHDVGLHEDRVFVAMDFLAGPTFGRWAEANRGKWREALALYRAAGEGLQAAHEAGLVHRDFKPDNVIIADGRPRVLDFGLARSSAVTRPYPVTRQTHDDPMLDTGPPDSISASASGRLLQRPITRVGAIMGTPAYMSPEQHLGEEVGAASDQFSFCVSFYEALYGQSPFVGETPAARALAVTQGELRPPPRNTEVPGWIFRVLERGLSVSPDDRWPSMRVLLDELATDPVGARRMMLGVLGVGVMALSLAAWGLLRPSDDEGCPSPTSALASSGAWSSGIADEIRGAFEATGAPFAAEAATTVVSDLDVYAGAWGKAYTEVCEATRTRHELSQAAMDLQMACLHDVRDRLGGWTRSLREADLGLVEHAREYRSRLPDVGTCRDLDDLGRLAAEPTEPARVEALEATKTALTEVAVVQAGGDMKLARERLEASLVTALGSGHDPLIAEVQLGRAQVLDHLAMHEEAARAAAAGMVAAERGGDRRRLAELRILYAMLVGDRMSRAEEGRAWIDLAAVTLDQIGGDTRLEARRQSHLGLIFAAAGDYKRELEAKAKAVELLEGISEADPIELAGVYNNYAASLAQHGEHQEALKHAQKALDLWSEALGPNHPRTGIAWASMALVHDEKGDYAAALEMHQKAIDILESALGADSPRLDELRNNLAITAINLGDLERGEKVFRAIVEKTEKRSGKDSVAVGKTLGNLGAVLRMQDRYEDSLVVQQRAVKIFEAKLGVDHPRSTATMSGLANAYEKLGRMREAIELREKVLRIEQESFGHDAPKISIAVGNLAWSLLALKGAEANAHRARARELSELSLVIATKHELKPDMEAFLRLVRARYLALHGGKSGAQEARALIAESKGILGELPASTERDMIVEIEAELSAGN